MGLDFLFVYPLDVISTLQDIRADIIGSKLAVMSSVASLLAALLCAFQLIKISHDYIEGQGVTLGVLLRPLIITFVVCQFNTFVAGPISGMCNIFTNSITKSMGDQEVQFVSLMGRLVDQHKSSAAADVVEHIDEERAEMDADGGDKQPVSKWDNFITSLKTWGGSLVSAIFRVNMSPSEIATALVADILAAIGVLLVKIFSFGLKIYSFVVLIILTLLGPFAFALAILPPFASAMGAWIGRFINVSLWIPIAQMVNFIFFYIINALGDQMIAGHDMGISWTLITICGVCLLCITGVPKIANYVIESAGSGGLHDNINNMLRSAWMYTLGRKSAK